MSGLRVDGPGNSDYKYNNVSSNAKSPDVQKSENTEAIVRAKAEPVPNMEMKKATKLESPYAYLSNPTLERLPNMVFTFADKMDDKGGDNPFMANSLNSLMNTMLDMQKMDYMA